MIAPDCACLQRMSCEGGTVGRQEVAISVAGLFMDRAGGLVLVDTVLTGHRHWSPDRSNDVSSERLCDRNTQCCR